MLTLPSILARTLGQHGQRTAVLDAECTLTWAAFGDRVARAASVLAEHGVVPGERFAEIA